MPQLPLRKALTLLILLLVVGAAAQLVLTTTKPTWGERHGFDPSKGADRLFPQQPIEQSFVAEHRKIDAVALWLHPDSPATSGWLDLTAGTDGTERQASARVSIETIPPSGIAVFNFAQPVVVAAGSQGTLELLLSGTDQTVLLNIQIDDSIYPDGSLAHRAADLAFQVRYRTSAVRSFSRTIVAALAILGSGAACAYLLIKPRSKKRYPLWSKRDWVVAASVGLVATLAYAAILLRPGIWQAPGDFAKDTSYVFATTQSLADGTWPTWNHLICGGTPLLGNPESNSLSVLPFLGLMLPSDQALLLLLGLEAGIGAAGVFLLSRLLGIRLLGSLTASSIAVFTAPYAYHIGEGFTMSGAALAYAPYALIGYLVSTKYDRTSGIAIAGVAMGLQFLRGETHILILVAAGLAVWALIDVLRTSQMLPLRTIVGAGAVALLLASPKLLAYQEHAESFATNLPTHVILITQQNLIRPVFLETPDRTEEVIVKHGSDEQWGVVGAYTGILPWLLAAIGLWPIARAHPGLAGMFGLVLIVSEGSFYDDVLRELEFAESILRLPSRNLLLLTLLLGPISGFGLDVVQRRLGTLGMPVAALVLGIVVFDLTTHTIPLLHTQLSQRVSGATEGTPQHPLAAIRSGAPQPALCADFLPEPAFLNDPARANLAFEPNTLTVPADGQAEVYVPAQFNNAWQSEEATLLARSDNSIHAIVHDPTSTISLHPTRTSVPAQQALLAASVVFVAGWLWPGRRPRD